MKWREQFLLLSRGKQIALVVCSLHFLIIFGSLGHHFATRKLKPARPMIVKTVVPITKPEPKIAQAKPAAAPKTAKPQPKKKESKVAKATKPAAKPAPAPIQKKAEETAAVEYKPKPQLLIPSKVVAKEETKVETAEDPRYSEFLIAYLQNTLDLPELGEVRMKIQIDRFGKLIDCEVLEAKSKKNEEFLKKELPDLSFPCLADFGILEASQTFTITFRNV
jgi:hypothetical protein